MKKLFKVIYLSCLLFTASALEARKPYQADVVVETSSVHVSATNLVDLKRDLSTASLEELIPLYTPVSQTGFAINLRGISVAAAFAANSTTLQVVIPDTGTTTSFTGSTRDESLALFKEYIHDAGVKKKLLNAYARYSPIDPIAGNPNSLLAGMAEADYQTYSLSSDCLCGSVGSQPVTHEFQTGLNVGRAFSGDFDTTAITMPNRYSYSPSRSWAFIIDMPISFNDNGGAYSLYTSLGLGLRMPVTDFWVLTPVVRYGVGGSFDLCTAGDFVSGGLNSALNFSFCSHVLSIINYAGYYASGNLWLTGINFNYNLHNIIYKNGLAITSCEGFSICGRDLKYNLWFTDSCFTHSKLYINHYDEVGAGLILDHLNPCIDYDSLSLGVSYQFGEKSYKALFVNLKYQF